MFNSIDKRTRLLTTLLPLFIGAAVSMSAQVTVTSGTVTGSSEPGGAPDVGSVQVQGANFGVTGTGLFGNADFATPNRSGQNVVSVTFSPVFTQTLSGTPFVPGGTSLILAYNGNTYYDQSSGSIVVSMSFTGPPVTALNTATGAGFGNYGAEVANVPFSMTGTVTLHSGSTTGPVVLSIPISGTGLYSAEQHGNALAGGPGGVPSGTATFQFYPPSPTMFGLDTTTEGAWTGKYGSDGYVIANGPSSLPPYAIVSVSGDTPYTWAAQTTDPRALQNGPGSLTGIASAYTQYPNTGFNINVNFTDGKTHRLALYVLDWDSFTRSELITIRDAASGIELDHETVANFNNGQYAFWDLSGNVVISVTPNSGTTPAVSGIFFDPPTGVTPQPSFTLSATSASIAAGSGGSSTVTVAPMNGFASAVSLAASGWPAGITGTFGTNPTTNSSGVTINVGPGVAAGPYSLPVTGTSGALVANTAIALTVTAAAPPTFTVSASAVSVAAGSSSYTNLTETPPIPVGNLNSYINTPPWPTGITIGPSNGNYTLGISVAANVAPGLYSLPINVHNGALNLDAQTNIALTVTAGPSLGSSATYVGVDNGAQGAWNGKYGANGYLIANLPSSLPSYASVSVTGASTFTWTPQTTDVRALQAGRGSTTGFASCYYGNTFNINVNLTDGNSHQVSLYLLDWDTSSRLENIVILDAATNAVLDQELLSAFHNGVWAVWNLKGNVVIQVTTYSPSSNAVISGIFFDPPGGPVPTYTLSATQTTISAGSTGSSTVVETPLNGFNSPVTLAASNWPAGFTANLAVTPVNNSWTVPVTVASNIAPGPYSLQVIGSGGGVNVPVTIAVNVTAPSTPSFTLGATATSIAPAATGFSTVSVTPLNGFASPVSLSAPNWPSGITATFVTNPVSSSTGVLIGVGSAVAPGPYMLTINGTSGALTSSTAISLTVLAPGTPRFTMNATELTLAAGANGSTSAYVTSYFGTISPVTLATAGWPAGITASFGTNPTSFTSTIAISVAPGVLPGSYPLTVTGLSGVLSSTATLALTVTAASTTGNSATFYGGDSVTEGAWTGKYGAAGYTIANGASVSPSYGYATVSGASNFTWAAQTTDPRALQSSPGSSVGIASAYTQYPNTGFTINVGVQDGNVHQVAFYLLDWDSTSRTETLTILDAATNSVLDTQTFSNFHNGQYAIWNIKGNVIVKVTPGAGMSPVLSGIFFN